MEVIESVKPLNYIREDIIYSIFASFICWNIFNLIIFNLKINDSHLKRNDYLDLRNRIVSFFHGFITMILAGYHMYFLHSECGNPNTRYDEIILIFSCGYFMYDFMAMAYLGLLDAAMAIHHIMAISGYMFAFYENRSAYFAI